MLHLHMHIWVNRYIVATDVHSIVYIVYAYIATYICALSDCTYACRGVYSMPLVTPLHSNGKVLR